MMKDFKESTFSTDKSTGDLRVLCVLLGGNKQGQAFAESCLRWTPQVAVGEEAIFLEIGKCSHIYSEETIVKGVLALARRFEMKVSIALDQDIPTSLAKARYHNQIKEKSNLPIEILNDYLSPFVRTHQLDKMIISLKLLGINQLGQFMEVRPNELASRFGKDGLFVSMRVRDARHIPWPRFKPEEFIVEEQQIESTQPLTNLEPLTFVLRGLIDKSMARLRGRSERATVVELILEQEPYSTVKQAKRRWLFELALPQGSTRGLLDIIKDRLARELQVTPLEAPLTGVTFKVLSTAPGAASQKDFFCKKEEQKEIMAALVSRLTERLGPHQAFVAESVENYRPERSWLRKFAEEDSEASEVVWPTPERPLRLYKEPKELSQFGDILVAQGKRWKVVKMLGPEHISGDWWKNQYERDYFRVATDTGEELWVYKEDKDLYLHGIFD